MYNHQNGNTVDISLRSHITIAYRTHRCGQLSSPVASVEEDQH